MHLEPAAVEPMRQLDHLALGSPRQELGKEQRDGETGRQSHAHFHLSKRGAINFAQKRRKTSNDRGLLRLIGGNVRPGSGSAFPND